MKIKKGATYGISALFLCMLLCWFFIPSYFFIIKQCSFVFDACFSETLQYAVTQKIRDELLQKPFGLISCDVVQKEFPAVAVIGTQYQQGGNVYCQVQAFCPLICVNEEYVMMENGELQNVANFVPALIKELPSIIIQQEGMPQLSDFFKQYVKKIPLSFYKLFSITWVDHTFIAFHDKAHRALSMVVHHETECNERLLCRYEQIKQQILKQRLYDKKKWRIDMRFKNHSVVAQGGVGDL
jgi:hypothetical protein